MNLPFTIQVPVYNETKALEFSALYFDRLGAPVRYVLDSKCTPAAAETLQRLGRKPIFFTNDKPFIENGYERFVALSPTDWILRLDCDEAPSAELIAACSDFVRDDTRGVAGFERHQILWKDSRLFTAAAERFVPTAHRQWRLFNRKRVTFNRKIHTPGINFDNPIEMSPEARLYHLSWTFLSWSDRVEKAARYDRFGQPEFNRINQLFPIEAADWRELDAPLLSRAFIESEDALARLV